MSQMFSRRIQSFFLLALLQLVQLVLLPSCFWKNNVSEKLAEKPDEKPAIAEKTPSAKTVVVLEGKKTPPKDQELQRLMRYLEQADSVHREAWWVVANDRKVQGRSIFGKAQRALAGELNLKLANKSIFSCDRYLVKREIGSALGLPQKGELFEKCSAKSEASRFAEFDLSNKTEADIFFYPQYLSDVVGIATSILNRKVHCHMKGDEEGRLHRLSCKNLAQDRNSTQSIQFSVYDYEKDGKNLMTLKGQVFENLSPVRKIQAQVPMSGKIEVTEIQTEAPEVVVVPPAPPAATATLPADGIPTAVERPASRGANPPGVVKGTAAAPARGQIQPRATRPRDQAVPASDNSGEIVEGQNPIEGQNPAEGQGPVEVPSPVDPNAPAAEEVDPSGHPLPAVVDPNGVQMQSVDANAPSPAHGENPPVTPGPEVSPEQPIRAPPVPEPLPSLR